MIVTLISFIIVIGIIIFFHELGHFITAKLSGVRVETFSLGFPPKMIGKKIGETEYQIAWVPLGGYVKMAGMLDESFDEDFDKNDPRGFLNQPLLKKILIITGGVIMNILLAFILYTGLTAVEGVGKLKGTVISLVTEGTPAAKAGLQPGDRITEIEGQLVAEWEELTRIIRRYPDIPITIKWERQDSVLSREITPLSVPDINLDTGEKGSVGKLGIAGTLELTPVSLPQSVLYGAAHVVGIVHLNILSLKMLISGQAGVSDLTGPLGIARMSGDSARSGIANFIAFIAFISVSIGFLNILPIPMLDGGHLVFILIEAVIRRPIPDKIKMNLMRVGLAALLLLMIVVSYHDILRFFN
ncbi:MAG: RIP metalloprotease RseP [Calditrichota bacterium]